MVILSPIEPNRHKLCFVTSKRMCFHRALLVEFPQKTKDHVFPPEKLRMFGTKTTGCKSQKLPNFLFRQDSHEKGNESARPKNVFSSILKNRRVHKWCSIKGDTLSNMKPDNKIDPTYTDHAIK